MASGWRPACLASFLVASGIARQRHASVVLCIAIGPLALCGLVTSLGCAGCTGTNPSGARSRRSSASTGRRGKSHAAVAKLAERIAMTLLAQCLSIDQMGHSRPRARIGHLGSGLGSPKGQEKSQSLNERMFGRKSNKKKHKIPQRVLQENMKILQGFVAKHEILARFPFLIFGGFANHFRVVLKKV